MSRRSTRPRPSSTPRTTRRKRPRFNFGGYVSHTDLDQAPVAPRGSLGGVPVIDLAAPHEAVVAAIAQACRDWGFFQIVGHGVSPGEVERVIATARAFFVRPREA